MKNLLLPCPFCGGEAKVQINHSAAQGASDKTACVVCEKCGCRTKEVIEWGNDFIDIASSLWNTRTTEQKL